MARIKPGKGWMKLGESVYEHDSGIRVHTYGLLLRADGSWAYGTKWPESQELDRCIRMCGNRRRGVMVWGLRHGRSDKGLMTCRR